MYANNLKLLRKALNLSVEKLSQRLDIPASTLWGYEGGKKIPSIKLCIRLYRVLNVNLNWLVSGKGEMFNAPTYEQVEDELTQKVEAILRKNGLMK